MSQAKANVRIRKMTSLTEEEVREKYEKIEKEPNVEDVCKPADGDVHYHNGVKGGVVKMLEQSRALLGYPNSPTSEGLRLRKSEEAGALENYDSDQEEEGDRESDDRTVDVKYGDKEDFQRPSNLDLVVGFLRFFNFLSCATAVFGVTFSILYSLSSPASDMVISANLSTVYNIWSPITLSPDQQYSR